MTDLRVAPGKRRAWDLRASVALGWAVLLAAAMSTQFLVQPFIWRSFSLPEIAAGWLDFLLSNAAVTLSIAAALTVAGRLPIAGPRLRAAALAVSVLMGALAGQLLWQGRFRQLYNGPDAVIGVVLRWSVVSGCLTVIYHNWLVGAAAAAEAEAAERQRSELQRLASQSELDVLQRQIEPHFLFNTLATVRGLYRTEPARGARLLADLLQFMRSSLAAPGGGRCSLGRELELVRAYLGVCGARMGARLRVTLEVEPSLLDREFPALALATLVENAIIHGLTPSPQGGEVRVTARVERGRLEVSVDDTGVGFTGEGGSGIGLANTRARLQALYGADAGLRLGGRAGGGFSASLWLPSRAAA